MELKKNKALDLINKKSSKSETEKNQSSEILLTTEKIRCEEE